MDNILEIRDLQTQFMTRKGTVYAVNGITLHVKPGETLAVVGESGSGKSVMGRSIMRLVPPPGKITGGQITFAGQQVLDMEEKTMRQLRGNRISMVFQEPALHLNPLYSCGELIAEVLMTHKNLSKREARKQAVALLSEVAIPSPELRVTEYPHQLSGGMQQRVMLAMAISCQPDLLIADEPTSALDVTTQVQILNLLLRLRDQYHMAIIFITHDIGVVAAFADRIAVMYAGALVEEGTTARILRDPAHPYTQGLMLSLPTLADPPHSRLRTIPGDTPDRNLLPRGCPFAPRCPHREPRCDAEMPPVTVLSDDHTVRCWLHSH